MYQGFAEYYDALMDDVDYKAWSNYLIREIEDAFQSEKVKVLDAACGSGKMSIAMKKAGYDVIGSDLSEDMLRIAAQNARLAGLMIPFVKQKLQAIEVHRAVDVVNCSCDGVNYLLSDDDLSAFFLSAFKALKPSGMLMFDISSQYKLSEVLAGNCFGEDRENIAYLWQNSFDCESKILQMDLSFFVKNDDGNFRRFRESHFQKAHSVELLKAHMEKVGFTDISVCNAFEKTKASLDSQRIQFFARKQ